MLPCMFSIMKCIHALFLHRAPPPLPHVYTGNAKSQMVGQLQGAISTMRATGNRDFTKVLGVVHHHHHHDDDDDDQQVDVHELSDQEFLHRQRVRRVFRTVDRDNSGRIERSELDHLLVMLGLRVAPYEMRAIFDYVDSDNSGTIEFDEFYEWCVSGVCVCKAHAFLLLFFFAVD